ncbi:MAG: hypothetical protein ABIN91_10955 [Mucilaginibacter sp.]|uniref:hypothetical protein n=1 Tax=Mucilaginibacter sp. TaxID=1882438 RepID=UPI003262F292
MKNYTIIPNSGHPYTNIREGLMHPEIGIPSPAQRGEILLRVLHTNGRETPLPFYKHEIQEVK